ncbi:MAG: hypothetical protein ACW99Q_15930 [Candidatus Kariarchaeaceae archaeon]|jgi:hypothetical protein
MIVKLTTAQEGNAPVHLLNSETVHNFRHFVEDTYGHGVWHKLNTFPEFKKAITEYVDEYGCIAFQILSDFVSSEIDAPIEPLLQEFLFYMQINSSN